MTMTLRRTAFAALLLVLPLPVLAQPITPDEAARIDAAVAEALRETKTPSAQVAVVRDGRLVFSRAYGTASARLGPATTAMPYQVASNSKQFTAMGLLLLEDEGKLSLDDKVSKWVPGISGGDVITIRQLLSHTAGLQDYWPHDFAFVDMEKPTTPQKIVDKWAKKPLDYAPGTQWQYSNTGYVVAGMILEKAAGEPMLRFLERRIFRPLGMQVVSQDDAVGPRFVAGYERAAGGPVRAITPPGGSWMFATGELAMSAESLARWNIARLNRSLVPAEDWTTQETPIIKADGTTTNYGLGVFTTTVRGRRVVHHSGGAVGFVTQNWVYPDSKASITVLTNADFGGAASSLLAGIEKIVLPTTPVVSASETMREADIAPIVAALAAGRIDPATSTENMRYYFNARRLPDYVAALRSLGALTRVEPQGTPRLRGGFVQRGYTLHFANGKASLATFAEPGASGRWEQFIIEPE